MFKCSVCLAKDEELVYLRGQVSSLADKLVELASRSVPALYAPLVSYSANSTWDGTASGRVHHNEFGEIETVE